MLPEGILHNEVIQTDCEGCLFQSLIVLGQHKSRLPDTKNVNLNISSLTSRSLNIYRIGNRVST